MTKKYFTSLLFLTILFACNQKENKAVDTTHSDTTIPSTDNRYSNVLDDYMSFVSKLDTSAVETATIAAEKYRELFKNEEVDVRDKGFAIFYIYYENLDKGISEIHRNDPNFDTYASEESLQASNKIRDYKEKLQRNGFQLVSTEGITYIQQDRNFIAKQFYSFVSQTMKEYLEQIIKEDKEGFVDEAHLAIEPKLYVNRLMWWEKFIYKNKGFPLMDKAKGHRKELLTFFLVGMEYSPVLDVESNELSEYYKTAYTYLHKKYPSSETNKIVNPYFKALLKNDNKKANAILTDYKNKDIVIDFEKSL